MSNTLKILMTPKSLEREIISFLVDELGMDGNAINESTALFTSGILSSVDLIQLIMMIEEKYGVAIEFASMSVDLIDTVAKLAQHICQQAGAQV